MVHPVSRKCEANKTSHTFTFNQTSYKVLYMNWRVHGILCKLFQIVYTRHECSSHSACKCVNCIYAYICTIYIYMNICMRRNTFDSLHAVRARVVCAIRANHSVCLCARREFDNLLFTHTHTHLQLAPYSRTQHNLVIYVFVLLLARMMIVLEAI